jgi:thioesterase domain-containing protein
MYSTGDVAAFREDGAIEFRGRADRQVKIRGFRVEPAEIEIRLNEHASVRDCAVVPVPDGSDRLSLAAYLVLSAEPGPSSADLREWLAAALPPYMIPAAFHRLPELPRTASGKIDRRALGRDTGDELPEPAMVAPDFTSLERTIAEVWQATLGCTVGSPDENFFDIGGHSLLAVSLIRGLEKRLGLDLPVSLLFEAPTVALQATRVKTQRDQTSIRPLLVDIQPKGDRPPLFCIHSYGGYVINYRLLAELLPPDQPVWGIRAPQTAAGLIQFDSLGKLAAFYMDELRRRFPDGPFLLAGYSSGGIIAYEMARQLEDQGLSAPFVGMFDTCLLRSDLRPSRLTSPDMWWNFIKNIPFWLLDLIRPEPESRPQTQHAYRERVRTVLGKDRYDWMKDVREDRKEFAFRHLAVLQKYTPPPSGLHVHVFRSRVRGVFHPQTTDLGWGRYARGGVTVHHIRGRHAAVLREPAVADLANQLATAMDQSLKSRVAPVPDRPTKGIGR